MCVVRNALTGFRSGWPKKKAVSSTFDVKSETEPAQVDRFDYAPDDSENDEKEATSTSLKRPTKDNEPSKVLSTKFSNKLLTTGIVFLSSPTLKLSSGGPPGSQRPL